ncbi:SAV_2336 N-terminal domain-related protein [Streptomyces lonegramiae]|uniref:SAV_2336 N-terminal domain-related protein n=1 Tax=Streptomyces lonegramiae TaxID=3075524 RepID=A0ABU2XAQ5_9ACTN|nr:SAV_2336 N-terminal domain-related protein [Streptomyces sp. DSM 41529]MDT0543005.1 SAV_2336 N-terminal domain-related protein [Streptomyces sp. DSM 41529]
MAGEGRGGRGPQALGQLNDALAILSNSGAELSQEQLLDALWLATRLPAGAAGAAGAGAAGAGAPLERARSAASSSDTSSGTSPDPAAARPRPSVPAASPTSQQPPSRQSRPADGASGLYGAIEPPPAPGAPAPPAARRALPLRVPEAKALRAELPIGRALRPLKQHRPNPLKREVDEVATATALAETGLPDVVTRPARERWLDLALVVDDGMSMLLWRRLAVELRTLLQRAGAFRVVRVLGLHTRGDDAPVLRAKPYVPESPALPVTAVSDPSGHTLVLVLSDGVGAAWRDGRMSAVLERWAGHGPTAVMHALPPRLWEGTGIRAQRWQVRTRRPGSPGTDWTVTDPVLPPELARFDGVPVPVLEPDAGPLADWARLIASASGTAVLPLLAPPRPRRPAAAPSSAAGPGDDLSRLLRFREAASPEAYRLAAHLAAVAPLPVPVMRLVQEAVEWRADTGHLAEVFLGGLMRPAEPPASAGPGPFPPQQRPFTFTDTVRRALLGAVPLPELDETRGLVGRRLKELAGSSPDFPAWLAHPSGADHLPAQARPFGTVEQRLAARLGAPPVRATLVAASRWRPLRPEDPRTIGPYKLRMTDPSGIRVTTYIGDEDAYGEQVVIHTALEANGLRAADLLRVQAEALRRMDGRYAARLLRQDLDCPTPWIAEEPFVAERLSDIPLSSDADRAFAVARQLADAVRVCAAEGMAHGDLRQGTVYVSDDNELFLTAWSSACIDGVPSPTLIRGPRTPRDNVHELAEILLDLGGGARFGIRGAPYDLSHWRGVWRPVRDVVLACLALDPYVRPTASEVWAAFGGFDSATPPPVPVPEPEPEPVADSAPELTRQQRADGWTPLSDRDPRSLGPFTLHAHIRTHNGTTAYLGRDPDGRYATLRTVDRESRRRKRRTELTGLSTEAEALSRMNGRYAPKLLGLDLDAEPPWIAEEHVLASGGSVARTLTAQLSDGTVRDWDAQTTATIGWRLAEAVHLCSAEGMVHGNLTTDTVLVTDRTVRLVEWDSATIDDRSRNRLGPRGYTSDIIALGKVLVALSGGHTTTRSEPVEVQGPDGSPRLSSLFYTSTEAEWAGSRWEGGACEPLRDVVTACLSNVTRPTAREVADVFSQVVMRTDSRARSDDVAPGHEPDLVRVPVTPGHRIAVLGLRESTDDAARTTLALGRVFARILQDPVIAVDGDPDAGHLTHLSRRGFSGRLGNLASLLRVPDAVRRFIARTDDGLDILSYIPPSGDRSIENPAFWRISTEYALALIHAGAGPNPGQPAMHALNAADQLVLVWSAEDSGLPADVDATLEWLSTHGHAELLRRSIVVVTDVRPDTIKVMPHGHVMPRFDGKCRAVVMIPYDPHLSSGRQLDFDALHPMTVRAFWDLAARLSEGFTPQDGGPPG